MNISEANAVATVSEALAGDRRRTPDMVERAVRYLDERVHKALMAGPSQDEVDQAVKRLAHITGGHR